MSYLLLLPVSYPLALPAGAAGTALADHAPPQITNYPEYERFFIIGYIIGYYEYNIRNKCQQRLL